MTYGWTTDNQRETIIPFHLCVAGNKKVLFVCVQVLRPSQPNGVMSSVVSLPNHTFTGQV